MGVARGLLALHGHDPIDASDAAWVGALLRADEIDHLIFIRRVLENTAKESQKQSRRSSGMRFRGRRR